MKQRVASDSAKPTSSVIEDYLQILHYLSRDGYTVIAARLAERLNVTPPTVTVTLQLMQRDGLIEHGPRKEILLTPEGRREAEDIVRRHALAERLLTDLLKMPWHESHEEAHGVEHAISPKIEARLLQALGNPTTFEYDADGERTARTDADGHRVTYAYDAFGRQIDRGRAFTLIGEPS